VSIELLGLAGLSADSRVIDIGGGASTLVDDLRDRGVRDVSVLDVSDETLAIARKRLGDRVEEVNWYVADVLHGPASWGIQCNRPPANRLMQLILQISAWA